MDSIKTVVFRMYNESGHLIPSFYLAQQLKKLGYFQVIYIANSSFKNEIIAQGFIFEPEPLFDNIVAQYPQSIPPKSYFQRLRYLFSQSRRSANINFIKNLTQLIEKYRPCLAFIDELCIEYCMTFSSLKIPTTTLSTYLLSYQDTNIPPPNSSVIPNNRLSNRLCISALWHLTYCTRLAQQISLFLTYPGGDFYYRNLASLLSYPYANRISAKKFYWIDDKKLNKLVLCPADFDFPRPPLSNINYIENCVDETRAGKNFTWSNLALPANKPLVYCSFGTQSHKSIATISQFIGKLIEIFSLRPDINIIISLGNSISSKEFGPTSNNIKLVQMIPQIQVLKKCRVMITHGGLGTIKECIHFGVPMLVYPVNKHVDQIGNAARVQYHKIGLVGNIKKDNAAKIEKKIIELLDNPQLKTNIDEMYVKMNQARLNSNFIKYVYKQLGQT